MKPAKNKEYIVAMKKTQAQIKKIYPITTATF